MDKYLESPLAKPQFRLSNSFFEALRKLFLKGSPEETSKGHSKRKWPGGVGGDNVLR